MMRMEDMTSSSSFCGNIASSVVSSSMGYPSSLSSYVSRDLAHGISSRLTLSNLTSTKSVIKEGTFVSIKDEKFVEFLVSIGVSRETASRVLGTKWYVRIWRDGELWGLRVSCKELPHLTFMETFLDGVVKVVDHPLFGGKCLVIFRRSMVGDHFKISCESERFGKMVWEKVFFDEGVHMTFKCKGRTISEVWKRTVKIDGGYILERGENIESYFRSTGDKELVTRMKDYKLTIGTIGNTIRMSECFGDLGVFSNHMEMDTEIPFRSPSDKRHGDTPLTRALLTKIGVGKFLLLCKGVEDELSEEWKLSFRDDGLIISCLEKRTGQTCRLFMRKIVDMTGTYRMISMVGFEKYAEVMGIPSSEITEIINDTSCKMVILDKGNGWQRHRIIRKKYPMDYSFKLDEEFSFDHPILKEKFRSIGTVCNKTLVLSHRTSKGIMLRRMHFNDNFLTIFVSLPKYHVDFKMVLVKSSSMTEKVDKIEKMC